MNSNSKRSNEPPVTFLIGPARSGTSLLYKTLSLHPRIGYISNWVRRYPAFPEVAVFDRVAHRFPEARRAAWFGDGANAYVYGAARSRARRAFPMPVEGEPLYTRADIGIPTDSTDRGTAEQHEAIRRSFGRILRADGGDVLVTKRIANNLRIPLLAAAFPAARFVRLVRDGRAVAYSLSRVDWWETDPVWWYGGTPAQWAADGGDPWEICARNWVEEMEAAERGLSAVPPEQVMTLRYEEFVREPIDHLHAIAEFMGVGVLEAWDDALRQLRFPDRNEQWAESLTDEARLTIEKWQRPMLDRFGY